MVSSPGARCYLHGPAYWAGKAGIDVDIVLVEIDEQSIRTLAPYFGRWPWPRTVHAHLLQFLTPARPRAGAGARR